MAEKGSRKRLTYVTDLACTPSGGGSYVVNWHTFNELQKCFEVSYAGPIVPKPPVVASTISKVRRRILKAPGAYVYFSEETLEDNARRVERAIAPGSDAIVFRSAARWSHVRTTLPYFVYLDAVTHTFFSNTFSASDFIRSDIDRIWRDEAAFLEGASGVYFESEWGMRAAVEAYGLRAAHYHVAKRGGVFDPPDADTWTGRNCQLVSIAMDFNQKGGDLITAAYARLKPRFPALSWRIIGGRPDRTTMEMAGVTYEGVLYTDVPGEAAKFRSILADSFLLVHPTREDTSPLVITEAAYFGCPAISVNAFAIPELLIDRETGLLLDPPADVDRLVNAIGTLLTDGSRYTQMRQSARRHSIEQFRWDRVGQILCDGIASVIGV